MMIRSGEKKGIVKTLKNKKTKTCEGACYFPRAKKISEIVFELLSGGKAEVISHQPRVIMK